MPTKPKITTNTNISADVVNAIKNSASNNYRENVPYATPDADSLRGIGAILMNNPALMNEFINTLVNRIAFDGVILWIVSLDKRSNAIETHTTNDFKIFSLPSIN